MSRNLFLFLSLKDFKRQHCGIVVQLGGNGGMSQSLGNKRKCDDIS